MTYPLKSSFNANVPHTVNAKYVPRFETNIATATKTTLTREFNKTHTLESAVRSVVGKAAAASTAMGDTQTNNDDEENNNGEEETDKPVIAVAAAAGKKPPAKAAGKKAAAAPKAKAAKPKAATKRERETVDLDDD